MNIVFKFNDVWILYVGLMFIFFMFVVNECNILAIANSNIVVVLFVFAVLQFSVAS